MYNGIGLTTARGSGTNGYVQRNLAFLREKPIAVKQMYNYGMVERTAPVHKAPNREILEHEKKRQIEVKVMEWASDAGILDRNIPQEEIDNLMAQKREELINNGNTMSDNSQLERGKMHKLQESHARNLRKERETANFKEALNIRGDYAEGAAFDPKLQEKRREESQALKLMKVMEEEDRIDREEKQKRKEERDVRHREKEKRKEKDREQRDDEDNGKEKERNKEREKEKDRDQRDNGKQRGDEDNGKEKERNDRETGRKKNK